MDATDCDMHHIPRVLQTCNHMVCTIAIATHRQRVVEQYLALYHVATVSVVVAHTADGSRARIGELVTVQLQAEGAGGTARPFGRRSRLPESEDESALSAWRLQQQHLDRGDHLKQT